MGETDHDEDKKSAERKPKNIGITSSGPVSLPEPFHLLEIQQRLFLNSSGYRIRSDTAASSSSGE
jgi:hypothetical protein